VRFERRIGFKRLKMLIDHAIDDLTWRARCRRDPQNPSRGWLDKDARVGRGVRGLIIGYKVHLAYDAETDMPLAFRVAPANENEKRQAAALLSDVAERVGVEAVVCDKQCSSRKVRDFIRTLGAKPVIPHPENQMRGVKGLLRVNKRLRVHDPRGLGGSTG